MSTNVDVTDDTVLDQLSFLRTVNAFRAYASTSTNVLEQRRRHMMQLPSEHRALLPFEIDADVFGPYRRGIAANQKFFDDVGDASRVLFGSYWPHTSPEAAAGAGDVTPTALDIDKVFSTLRQVVRDWSSEGALERDMAYGPILSYLEETYPLHVRSAVRVLVPGAGLSRLSVELACMGFCAVGNEFSYHMLIAGHCLMNHVTENGTFLLCPYVDSTCNLISRGHQFTTVAVPDHSTYELVSALEEQGRTFGELSMIAGDFTEVYSRPSEHGKWHVVCSSFFLDTAHNIVQYLLIMFRILCPGGLVVNVGPLLYHFAESTTNEPSVELSLEEVMGVAKKIGFNIIVPPQLRQATYTNNPSSMKQLVYVAAFFVLQRPETIGQSFSACSETPC